MDRMYKCQSIKQFVKYNSSVQIEIDSSRVDEIGVLSPDLAHKHALVEESWILKKNLFENKQNSKKRDITQIWDFSS